MLKLIYFQTCSPERKKERKKEKRLFNKLRDQFRNVTDMQNAYLFLSSIYY